jgi:hypothetical protein
VQDFDPYVIEKDPWGKDFRPFWRDKEYINHWISKLEVPLFLYYP